MLAALSSSVVAIVATLRETIDDFDARYRNHQRAQERDEDFQRLRDQLKGMNEALQLIRQRLDIDRDGKPLSTLPQLRSGDTSFRHFQRVNLGVTARQFPST